MIDKPAPGPLLWSVNKNLLPVFLLPALALGAIGFLVPPGSRTDDGLPLDYFLWAMAGFWILTSSVMLLIFSSINRRKVDLYKNGLAGTARILAAEQTGTTINDNPEMALTLEVNDGFRSPYTTMHKEAIPLLKLQQLQAGAEIEIRADRIRKGRLLLLLR